jgi:hypothetical protein
MMAALIFQVNCISPEKPFSEQRQLTQAEKSRMVSAISHLNADSGAHQFLLQCGPQAVPTLIESLSTVTWPNRIWVIFTLEDIGDKRAVPALVAIADKCPNAQMNASIRTYGRGPESDAVYARGAVAKILCPVFRDRYKTLPCPDDVVCENGDIEFNTEIVPYYKDVDKWYVEWRKHYSPSLYSKP